MFKLNISETNTLIRYQNAILSHKNGIFMGGGDLTYDPWIWLKVTSMGSTASNRKSAKIPYNISFLMIHFTNRKSAKVPYNSVFLMIHFTLRDQNRSFWCHGWLKNKICNLCYEMRLLRSGPQIFQGLENYYWALQVVEFSFFFMFWKPLFLVKSWNIIF